MKKKTSDWFVVDNQGMSRMYGLYNKNFVVRELLQNAFDENITRCTISLEWTQGVATIVVEDNSPEGFNDLKDAYTLYKHTSKRSDATKRGRFNMGEKQAISQAEFAIIKTTKGCVTFDKINGRTVSGRSKTKSGSIVHLVVKMKKDEFLGCVEFCKGVYVPEGIEFILYVSDGKEILPYRKPFKTFTATLPTVIDNGEAFRPTSRKTVVNVYQNDKEEKFLFELGLPICEIDCDFDIDVQQKVPLSEDRNSVSPAFLKRLYAETLNQVHESVRPEDASRVWVRTATTSDAIADDVAQEIFKKRFGDKALVANPNDPLSMDKAISAGYNVIYGAEMDKDEWSRFKKVGLAESTTSKFGSTTVDCVDVPLADITPAQKAIARMAQKIAQKTLGIYVSCKFIKSPKASVAADYGAKTIRFNVSKISKVLWGPDTQGELHPEMYKLIVHEIAHEKGYHYETGYHDALSDIHTKLSYLRRENPDWFKLK